MVQSQETKSPYPMMRLEAIRKRPRRFEATQKSNLKAIMYASLLVYMFSMCCLAVLIHFAGTETYLNTKSFDSACAFKSKALHVCVRYEVSVKSFVLKRSEAGTPCFPPWTILAAVSSQSRCSCRPIHAQHRHACCNTPRCHGLSKYSHLSVCICMYIPLPTGRVPCWCFFAAVWQGGTLCRPISLQWMEHISNSWPFMYSVFHSAQGKDIVIQR